MGNFPPLILVLNSLEAAIRDFEVFTYGAWNGAYVDHLWVMSGPWNIINGIAGLALILACTFPSFADRLAPVYDD